MSRSVPDAALRELLSAGGAMGALIGGHDWSSSLLGPAEDWPQSLRTSLSICLSSRFPMFLFWGTDLVQLYNDSFVPVLGAKHPGALGQPARETWAETWNVVGPMLEQVIAGGEAAYFEDLLVILERSGFAEECYFTFCYSPVRAESGGVAGVFGTVSETTAQVVEARRLAVLAELSERTRTLGSPAEVCGVACEVFAAHPAEVPFALLYLLDRDEDKAILAGSSGLAPGTSLSLPVAAVSGGGEDEAFSWPLGQAGPVEITGLDQELLAGMRRDGLPPPSSAIMMPLGQAGAGGPDSVMIVGLCGGRPLDAGYRRFVRLASGYLSAAMADATALEAARDQAAQLAELDRAKTMFFSNVSHELRTPLTLMMAPLEDLLAEPGTLSPPDRDKAEMAYRNTLRLHRQVNTLLEFSGAAGGAAAPRPEPLDLGRVTAELASLFEVAMERGGLRFVLDCPPLRRPVWADREMWEQVVLNLLSNAFKFTTAGEITVTVDTVAGQARVRVSDTGAGIPASDLPRLFDRFYRVAGTAGRSGEGSGIGLSLARDLVQRHGGTITVTSVVGSGSTFTVLLPFGQAPPVAAVPDAAAGGGARPEAYVHEALGWAAAAQGSPVSGPPEILIVDDNADMRAYLTSALAPHWRVQAASDGRAAMQAIACQQPELILTDVMMPRLDGFGLLSELRSDPATRDIPVVMVSARAGSEALISGLDVGADDYLIKPFTRAELIARVRTHLRAARQRSQSAARIQALADITRDINASLDPAQISRTLMRHLVPAYAEKCVIKLASDASATGPGSALPSGAAPGELALPLICRDHAIGTVLLTGPTPIALDPAAQAFLAELTSRAALAIDNAARYQHDHSTALHLQAAMLTDLPVVPGLEIAALYQPAAVSDLVGGDWYDSFLIPAAPGSTRAGTSLALVIGDVTGHDLHAATVMGQIRSMLRQAVLDHPARGPHEAVTALEHACAVLPVDASGTLILARLDQAAHLDQADGLDQADDAWTLTWTNAGHPPPMICHPDGTVHSPGEHDFMLYPQIRHPSALRTEHRRQLRPGTTIVFYTDGLVDRPGSSYDHDVEQLAEILAAHQASPLSQLLSTAAAQIAGPLHADDIAMLALRIQPGQPQPGSPDSPA